MFAAMMSAEDGSGWTGLQCNAPTVVERLKAGDDALFRQVVRELTPLLTRLARAFAQTDAAAQDAVRDTWVLVIDKLDSFECRSSLKTWVCGILIRTARRSGAQDSRTMPISSGWEAERTPAVDPARFHGRHGPSVRGAWSAPPVRWDEMPEERLAAKELRHVIACAIAELPDEQREIIIARDVVGMDAAEAAHALGVTSGNQRVLLHRARSNVRSALERAGSEHLGTEVAVTVADPDGKPRGPAP